MVLREIPQSDTRDTNVMAALGNMSPTAGKYYRPIPDRDAAQSPFRVDEGYSEDPRSQADSDTEQDAEMVNMETLDMSATRESAARQWLLSQPVGTRIGKTKCSRGL